MCILGSADSPESKNICKEILYNAFLWKNLFTRHFCIKIFLS